jgi:alpha-1,2-mannosyltransferase
MSQAPPPAETAVEHDTAPSVPAERGWPFTPATAVIVVSTVLGLALRLLYFAPKGHLLGVTEYDDGVYFGAAVRLVHGVVPYKDFILVQPPGLPLLMTPFAALSRAIGTADGMAIGRLLTALAGAASVPLAGWLVRRRGTLALIITCGVTAVFPYAIQAAHTVLQEPWLVLFCLLGMLAVFDDDRLTSSARRLAWGGAAFGFAGAVKLWAVFPFLILIVMFLLGRRIREAGVFTGGAAVGFLVPVLPFFALAPSNFYHGVFVAQVVRVDDVRTSLWTRLEDLTGLTTTAHGAIALITVLIILVVVAACLGASLLTRQLPPPLEWFVLVTAVVLLAAFLEPADFYYHYAGFFAPFLALAIALPLARLAAALQEKGRLQASGFHFGTMVGAAASVLLVILFISQAHTLAQAKPSVVPTSADKVIPAGACVLTDQVSYTLMAGRFTSDVPGCAQIVDGLGTDLDLSNGKNGVTGAGKNPAVAALWMNAFRHAQYIWLSSPITGISDRRIAWTPALHAYFNANFSQVKHHDRLYQRIGLPGA